MNTGSHRRARGGLIGRPLDRLDVSLVGMCVDDIRYLRVPAVLGYGQVGSAMG